MKHFRVVRKHKGARDYDALCSCYLQREWILGAARAGNYEDRNTIQYQPPHNALDRVKYAIAVSLATHARGECRAYY